MTPALDLGRRALAVLAGPLPADVSTWARRSLLDTLAVQLAGTRSELFAVADAVTPLHPGSTPIPGTTRSAAPHWAAHLGAVAASALDLDDGSYRGGGIHAGSTVLPVLLTAEPRLSLDRMLRALVLGHEVAIRAGYLNAPAMTGESYRASGYAACVGAAAALAAVRSGEPLVVEAAVRTAFATAPHSRMTSAASRESIGWAAATAVAAAQLAEYGYGDERADTRGTAPAGPTPFDQHAGDPFVRSLGEDFTAPQGYTKPWACCRAAHAMLEALLHLRARAGVQTSAVHRVVVDVVPGAAALTGTRPANLGEAQYALPWLAAVALLRGESHLTTLRNADRADRALLDVADRVLLRPRAPEVPDAYPATVRLECTDGQVHTAHVRHELGSYTRPLSATQFEAKVTGLLNKALREGISSELAALTTGPHATLGDLLHLIRTGLLPTPRPTTGRRNLRGQTTPP